jgi:hypothetical protein
VSLIVDGLGRAVGLNLVSGNQHDLTAVEQLIENSSSFMAIPDLGFDAKGLRKTLFSRGKRPEDSSASEQSDTALLIETRLRPLRFS